MKTRVLFSTTLLGILALTGCMSAPKYGDYRQEVDSWGYGKKVGIAFRDAGLDLLDIVSLEGGTGEGFLVNARLTKIAQAGAGYFDGLKCGNKGRCRGFWREKVAEGGLSVFYYKKIMTDPMWGASYSKEKGFFNHERYNYDDWTLLHNDDEHWGDVGVDIYALFGGVGFNFSPKETVDFVGSLINIPAAIIIDPIWEGLLGLKRADVDFADDDWRAELRRLYDLGYINQPPDIIPGVGEPRRD